jgi:hypothetical protein
MECIFIGFSFNDIGASTNKVICCHFPSNGKMLTSVGHDKKVKDTLLAYQLVIVYALPGISPSLYFLHVFVEEIHDEEAE